MQDLRFSIVIPTRERPETLKYCLKTCIEQDGFDNYEIVVSDNNSTPATKQVVDDFNSDKIKYYCTGRTIAMHENFEFALSQAKGEYIIFLGDDDGMLLKGLYNLDKVIKKTHYKAIAWDWILYYWPDGGPLGLENISIIPTSSKVRIMNGKKRIKEVITYNQAYTILPMIYVNGAIHRDLIADLRAKVGRVFLSVTPDVCSGMCFAYLSENFLYLDQPISIAAISGKGNGNNQFNKKRNRITNEFNELNNSSSIKFHAKMPNIRSMNAVVSEAFLQAKEKLFSDDDDIVLDRKAMIVKCLEDLVVFDNEEWDDSMEIIKRSLSDDIELTQWFNHLLSGIQPKITEISAKRLIKKGFNDNHLYLDASSFGCKNVYELAKFYDKSLNEEIVIPDHLIADEVETNLPQSSYLHKSLATKAYVRLKRATQILVRGY